MSARFSVVKCGQLEYGDIPVKLQEITAHFDAQPLDPLLPYSLHTDQARPRRDFKKCHVFTDAPSLRRALSEAARNGVPLLWHDHQWSGQFFQFIDRLVGVNPGPTVIEIHPPFKYYCSNEVTFLDRYGIFEDLCTKRFPQVQVVLENRRGNISGAGHFLEQDVSDLARLAEAIRRTTRRLKLVVDIPQLIGRPLENGRNQFGEFTDTLNMLRPLRDMIWGIHLWGWSARGGPHHGDLASLFGLRRKEECLTRMSDFFDDGTERYIYLEVKSYEVLASIYNDLRRFHLL